MTAAVQQPRGSPPPRWSILFLVICQLSTDLRSFPEHLTEAPAWHCSWHQASVNRVFTQFTFCWGETGNKLEEEIDDVSEEKLKG